MFFNKNKLLKVKMTFSIIIEFDYFNSSIEKSFSDGIFFHGHVGCFQHLQALIIGDFTVV